MEEGDEEWISKAELISNIGKISLYDRKIEKTQEALDKTKNVFLRIVKALSINFIITVIVVD